MTFNVMRKDPPQPSEEAMSRISTIKDWGNKLADFINEAPRSRENSLALTNLEQAVMWAVKGVAIADESGELYAK